MYYVKVVNGVIVEGPKELSNSDSDSPNIHWGANQLALNGYQLVDISYDKSTQKIDLANPVITDGIVSYNRTTLTTKEKDDVYNSQQDKKIEAELPSMEDMVKALWENVVNGDKTLSDSLFSIITSVKQKYPKK